MTYFINKYILINIFKMSPYLEIIVMAASILEKSGFRLICLCSFLVTPHALVTCNMKSVVLDYVSSVTSKPI